MIDSRSTRNHNKNFLFYSKKILEHTLSIVLLKQKLLIKFTIKLLLLIKINFDNVIGIIWLCWDCFASFNIFLIEQSNDFFYKYWKRLLSGFLMLMFPNAVENYFYQKKHMWRSYLSCNMRLLVFFHPTIQICWKSGIHLILLIMY